jgi:hypothetical protein
MATESGAAIFRAIADFAALRREARRTKQDLKDLGGQTGQADEELGKAERQATRTATALGKLGRALQGVHERWTKFEKSNAHKMFEGLTKAGDKLGGVLTTLRNKTLLLSGIAVAATASIGPVMSLVGAVVSLSGAVGLVPGGLLAGAAAAGVLKVAFNGVDEVLKNLSERDPKKFAESIKDLPPSMQKVAKAAWEIYPAVVAVKKSIQDRFWEGLEKPVKELAGKYLPLLRAQGATLAGTFNKMAKEFAGFLGQKSTVKDVNRALGDVNKMFRNLVGSVKPLGQALLDIFKVSAEFLPGMGKNTASLTQRFAEFIRTARESGRLKEWIQGGLDALRSLGQVLANIGRVLGAVFRAGSAEGNGFLQTLAAITDKVADFLNSVEGQEALRKLFAAARQAADVLMPVVRALALTLADVVPILVKIGEKLGPGVVAVINGLHKAIKEAEPFFLALGDAVSDLLSALGEAAPILGKILGGLVWAASPLGVLADVIRLIVDVFNLLPTPVQDSLTMVVGIGAAALVAAGLIGKLLAVAAKISGVFGKATTAAAKLIDTLGGDSTLATGVGPDGTVVDRDGKKQDGKKKGKIPTVAKGKFGLLGAVAGVASASAAFDMGGQAMDAFGQGAASKGEGVRKSIAAGLMGAAGVAAMFGPWGLVVAAALAAASVIVDNWDTIGPWLKQRWDDITAAFNQFAVWLGQSVMGLVTNIRTWFTGLMVDVGTAWTTGWQAVGDFFALIGSYIATKATELYNAVTGALGQFGGWVASSWTGFWTSANDVVIRVGGWIGDKASEVTNWVTGKLGEVGHWLSGAWSSAWRTAGDVVSSVGRGIANAVDAVVRAVEAAARAVGNALSKIGQGVSTAAGWAGRNLNPLNWFPHGGLVPGSGKAHRPIMAQPDEYVMPVKATRKFLPLLRAMNPYDRGGSPAMLEPGFGVADLVRNAAGAARSAATLAATAALARPRTTTSPRQAPAVGDIHVTQIIHNPAPEKPSETASRRIGRAASLGVHVALNGAA